MAIPHRDYGNIEQWHHAGKPVVLVRVAGARGSTPRGTDAAMAVTRDAIAGTIGGGQLEWLAIARAREMLAAGEIAETLDIPLGPEIGQCCGGRVQLDLQLLDETLLRILHDEAQGAAAQLRNVLIFGAGHTGKALAHALEPLPLKTVLVDERPGSFEGFVTGIETLCTPVPESAVRDAPPGSAFVAMTHSHAIDFLIMAEALKRGDAAYCGMIGSATKRAVFTHWLADNGYDKALAGRLTCPIGGTSVRDKRPEIIAALTAAEIITALA